MTATTTETASRAIKAVFAELGIDETRAIIVAQHAARPNNLTAEAMRLLCDAQFVASLTPVTVPQYRVEFPDLDADGAAKIDALLASGAWDDTSWHNEPCPRLTCDVFELFVDYADASLREFPEAARFSIHDESRVVLETDDWSDVMAFIDDGKRDFPAYNPAVLIDLADFLAIQARIERGETITFDELVVCHGPLTCEYDAYCTANGLPHASADEHDDRKLTQPQREWLADFCARWDRVDEAMR